MDEAKRFMRYVLPGLVSILLIIIFHWATNPCTIKNLFRDYGADGNATAFGAAVLLFLSSGALGYIFSTVYFLFSPCFMGLSHKPAIKTLLNLKYPLFFYDSRCGNEHRLNTNYITKQQALLIVNSWWWYLKGIDNGVKEIDKYLDRLSDAFHSLGATLIGSIISMSLVWLHYYQKGTGTYQCATKAIATFDQAFIIWSILNLFFAINFFSFRKYLQRYANTTFIAAVERYQWEFKKASFHKIIRR